MILTIDDEVLTIYFLSFPEITICLPIVSFHIVYLIRDKKVMITIDIFFFYMLFYNILLIRAYFLHENSTRLRLKI